MSDQQEAGAAVTSLEEVFLSREFGRAASPGIYVVGEPGEALDPLQLEEVFLSSAFGRPQPAARPPRIVPLREVPVGVALSERETVRYRAIAAVSGVAAAALAIAGITSGTGQSARPTVSARGPGPGSHPSDQNGGRPGALSGATPGVPAATVPATAVAATEGSGTVPSGSEVVLEVPPGTSVAVVPASPQAPSGAGGGAGAPAPGSSTAPGPTGGGGSVLSPVLVLVGNTAVTVGTTVTTASEQLGTALPVVSPVTGVLAGLGATVANFGHGVTAAV